MDKILLIEDSLEIGQNISALLIFNKFSVFYAKTGMHGLEYMNGHKPDLVLLDLTQSEIERQIFLKELKRTNIHESVPVLMLTGKIDKENINKLVASGIDDFITKPFRAMELVKTIEFYLEKRRTTNSYPENFKSNETCVVL